jgi:hypothetical protein
MYHYVIVIKSLYSFKIKIILFLAYYSPQMEFKVSFLVINWHIKPIKACVSLNKTALRLAWSYKRNTLQLESAHAVPVALKCPEALDWYSRHACCE